MVFDEVREEAKLKEVKGSSEDEPLTGWSAVQTLGDTNVLYSNTLDGLHHCGAGAWETLHMFRCASCFYTQIIYSVYYSMFFCASPWSSHFDRKLPEPKLLWLCFVDHSSFFRKYRRTEWRHHSWFHWRWKQSADVLIPTGLTVKHCMYVPFVKFGEFQLNFKIFALNSGNEASSPRPFNVSVP